MGERAVRRVRGAQGDGVSTRARVLTNLACLKRGRRGDVYAVASTGSGKTLAFVARRPWKACSASSVRCSVHHQRPQDQRAWRRDRRRRRLRVPRRRQGVPGPPVSARGTLHRRRTPAAILKLARDPEFCVAGGERRLPWCGRDRRPAGPSVTGRPPGRRDGASAATVRGFTATPGSAWMQKRPAEKRLVCVDAAMGQHVRHTHRGHGRGLGTLPAPSYRRRRMPPRSPGSSSTQHAGRVRARYLGRRARGPAPHALAHGPRVAATLKAATACEECTVLCTATSPLSMNFAGVTLVVQVRVHAARQLRTEGGPPGIMRGSC
jgi:hypothetical protein